MAHKATFAVVLALLLSSVVFADPPRIMNYQAKLTNSDGVALDGDYSITFRIYDAATGGTLLWYQTKTVTVTNGLFDEQLDLSINGGDTLKFNRPYWIALEVGSDGEMSPREKLAPVSFAFRSIYADTAKVVGSGAVQTDGTSITGDGTAANPLSAVLGNSIETGEITNGTIVNADISGSAAIDWSKINHPSLDNYQYWTATDGANNTDVNSTGSLTFTGTGGASVTVSSGTVTIDASSAGDGNNYTTGISFSGTSTKTLTLTRDGLSDLTASFTDDNTTYSAGNGISLSGTVFSVAGNDGLTQDADGLSVGAGDGINVSADNVSVKAADGTIEVTSEGIRQGNGATKATSSSYKLYRNY